MLLLTHADTTIDGISTNPESSCLVFFAFSLDVQPPIFLQGLLQFLKKFSYAKLNDGDTLERHYN